MTPTATARLLWLAHQAESDPHHEPTEPVRFTLAEAMSYIKTAWPDIDPRRARLALEFEGRGKEVVADLAGESPTGFLLADEIDAWAEAELVRTYGGTQTALF